MSNVKSRMWVIGQACQVCDEPSSGWHCGAVTCEACKKFFLRSNNDYDYLKFKCIRGNDCVIGRNTRTQFQFCRYQKCKQVGMNLNYKPFVGLLCRVCNGLASGIHYGAIVCDECKDFFQQSSKEQEGGEPYKCAENGNCEISATARNMCRFCRFQRCIQANMSTSCISVHQVISTQVKEQQEDARIDRLKKIDDLAKIVIRLGTHLNCVRSNLKKEKSLNRELQAKIERLAKQEWIRANMISLIVSRSSKQAHDRVVPEKATEIDR